jgi:hypothetical protein
MTGETARCSGMEPRFASFREFYPYYLHPLYSLRGDFTLLFEVLSGRRPW